MHQVNTHKLGDPTLLTASEAIAQHSILTRISTGVELCDGLTDRPHYIALQQADASEELACEPIIPGGDYFGIFDDQGGAVAIGDYLSPATDVPGAVKKVASTNVASFIAESAPGTSGDGIRMRAVAPFVF